MTVENSNRHHLIPILKNGKNTPTVRLHEICHEKIHSIWKESELRDNYHTMSAIAADPRIQSFVGWVRKQKHFNSTNKLSNQRRR